jgi:hypothetical protein
VSTRPQQEDEKRVEPLAVVAVSGLVLVDQALDRFRAEEPGPAQRARPAEIAEQRRQLAAEPSR